MTLVIFFQVHTHQFILYDDPEYVTDNREVRGGLTWQAVLWSFKTFAAGNWHPLTWMSHIVDVQLFGLDSAAHHLVNVGLHIVTTVLLFVFLAHATRARWKSAFVALVFAIHPLHVESVAWVAERKDVLCGVFLVLGLGAYTSYRNKPTWGRYAVLLLAFGMALMSKPTAVTFPVLLLLLDVWPLERLRPTWDSIRTQAGPALLEKLPLFLMSFAGAVLTFVAHRRSGAVSSIYVLSPVERIENAALSYVGYIGQFVWPLKLAAFYPYVFGHPLWQSAGAILILLGLTAVAIALFRRQPAVTIGWLWYVVSLIPMVGLVQVGAQAHADRYMYIPSIGLAIMLSWGAGELAKEFSSAYAKTALTVAALAVGSFWGALAWDYTNAWHDTVTLFSHAVAAGHNSVVARHQLGIAFKQSGQMDQAIDQFQNAVRLLPDSADERHALGKALLANGRPAEAAIELTAAARLAPRDALIHTDLATAFLQSGNVPEGLREYSLAIQCDPSNADAHAAYGGALIAAGRLREGLVELKQALPILTDRVAANPDNADAHYDLGTYYAYTEQADQAIHEYSEVIRLRPRDVDARFNLGITLASLGHYQDAIAEFTEAVALDPDRGRTHLYLGKCLLALKRYDDAEMEFRNAAHLDPQLAKTEPMLQRYLHR